MNIDRRLVYVAIVASVIYALYILFVPIKNEIPLPAQSKEDIFANVQRATEKAQLPTIKVEEIHYTDFRANSSVGRYLERNALTENEYATLIEEVSLYEYEVTSSTLLYTYSFEQDLLTGAEAINLQVEAEPFVHEYFGEEYSFKGREQAQDIFTDWDTKETYVADTSFPDIINVVDLYINDGIITSFEQYALALGYPKEGDSTAQIIVSLFIFLFLIGLVLFVTVHLIIKLIKKEIEAFWAPFGLSLVTGLSWLLTNKALGINILSFAIVESLILTYLTFVTLLIRWKRDERPLMERLRTLQPAVVHGLLLTAVGLVLAEGFFFIARYFDTWSSPVTMHNVLVELNPWLIPLFTLCIGLSAAISEEAIFRHYMIPMFERVGIFFALIVTSFLWGIMHIGYDMYPWYLYILEFFMLTGPFFFFVYKRYGFATAIFMHYFYNAWVTTLFLIYVDWQIAVVSLLVMFSPFLLFLIRRKESIHS